jgi:subtilisin family serine protease
MSPAGKSPAREGAGVLVDRLLRSLAAPLAALALAAAVPRAGAGDAPAPPDPATTAPAAHASAAGSAQQVLVMLRAPTAHARLDGSYGGSYTDAARAQARERLAERLAAQHGYAVVTVWPMPSLGMDCIVMTLPPGTSLAEGVAALEAHSEVAWAQPMNEFQAQGHTDPLYALQPAAREWNLDELHTVATGRSVHVAIVDSGIDEHHPDLAQTVDRRVNFVDGQEYVAEAHGTALAGLVAARADNGIGMVGIAPDARLLALRACWEVDARQTLCNSLSLAKALNFAIEHHAEIINMSLSGPVDPLLGRLIDVALARRQQVVAAVDARLANGGFPAAHPGVIAVADEADPASAAATSGAWAAPARDLPATAPGGGWRMVSGTSFAAGQVSGLLALMVQADASAPRSGGTPATRLVRLPGGGIDACASLLPRHGTSAAAPSPACHALVAAAAAAATGGMAAPAAQGAVAGR